MTWIPCVALFLGFLYWIPFLYHESTVHGWCSSSRLNLIKTVSIFTLHIPWLYYLITELICCYQVSSGLISFCLHTLVEIAFSLCLFFILLEFLTLKLIYKSACPGLRLKYIHTTKLGLRITNTIQFITFFQISGALAAIFLIIILLFDIQGIKVISQEQLESSLYPADYLSPILKIVSIVSVIYCFFLIVTNVNRIKHIASNVCLRVIEVFPNLLFE